MRTEVVFYKIRDTKSGLFSSGGCAPHFSKKGKTWRRLQDVRAHISQLRGYAVSSYASAELIEVRQVISETVVTSQSITAFTGQMAQDKETKKERIAQAEARRQEEEERALLARLQQKWGTPPADPT